MRGWNWQSRDEEKRKLRVSVARLEQALKAQRQGRKRSDEEVKKLQGENKYFTKRIQELEKRCRELEEQRDRYRAMVFKPNVKSKEEPGKETTENPTGVLSTRKGKRGRPKGHAGEGRRVPERADEVRRIYLDICPDCGEPLERSQSCQAHTVEDIPPVEQTRARTTRYERELQWCGRCKKTVKAVIEEVMPRNRLGINVLLYVFIHKYIGRSPWAIIVWNLNHWYGIKVSQGALVQMVHRARDRLGKRYEQLLEQIRAAPVKHADETGWRVNGRNHWLWGFFTNQQAYYVIEESRGKGVPENILKGLHPEDVLVRDDYAAYRKLGLKHQSCWRHLLGDSREAARQPGASEEVRILHEKLKQMFSALCEIIAQPFDLAERQIVYDDFGQKLQHIIDAKYHHQDTKKIQTRVANQNKNLLTALLYENVPLTNNLAERGIRPMVVTRKISGGSRSWKGAKTHAINMSILQTLRLQSQHFIPTLKNYLLSPI